MKILASGAAALALIFTCSVVPAPAMPGMQGGTAAPSVNPAERFNAMDADHDGKMTWNELSSARPNLNRNAFDTIDVDHNGFIDLEEWNVFSAGHGGSVSMPDMEGMMKAMREAGAPSSAAGSNMPLIMPPASSGSSGSGAHGMPLITPPTEGK